MQLQQSGFPAFTLALCIIYAMIAARLSSRVEIELVPEPDHTLSDITRSQDEVWAFCVSSAPRFSPLQRCLSGAGSFLNTAHDSMKIAT